MPSIICYGDSNTWGYEPQGLFGGRYPEALRWTGVLEDNGFEVINEGLCGRMIPIDPLLMKAMAKTMNSYKAPDIFLIMLGGNNILHEEISPAQIADKMDNFLDNLTRIKWYDPAKTLLATPAKLEEGSWVYEQEMIDKSLALPAFYKQLAEKHGMHFVDTTGWKIDKVFDGVHYSPKGHKAFGENMYEYIKKEFGIGAEEK